MISAEKFTHQPMPRQLGALAATLARISSGARQEKPAEMLAPMMNESIHFIEWIVPQAEPEIAAELADMQVMLGLWQKGLPNIQTERSQNILLSFLAKKWSDQVLGYSGLLDSA